MIDATGMPQTAVVIGGGSDIARETLRLLARRRLRKVLLAGRDATALDAVTQELRVLGVTAEATPLDVTDVNGLDRFSIEAAARLGEIDLVIMAVGDLGVAVLDGLDAAGVASTLATISADPRRPRWHWHRY